LKKFLYMIDLVVIDIKTVSKKVFGEKNEKHEWYKRFCALPCDLHGRSA
jgi:hypothetical protein